LIHLFYCSAFSLTPDPSPKERGGVIVEFNFLITIFISQPDLTPGPSPEDRGGVIVELNFLNCHFYF
jgi:hypothetical protein